MAVGLGGDGDTDEAVDVVAMVVSAEGARPEDESECYIQSWVDMGDNNSIGGSQRCDLGR